MSKPATIVAIAGVAFALTATGGAAEAHVFPISFPSSQSAYHTATGGDGLIPVGGQTPYFTTFGDYLFQNVVLPGMPNGFTDSFTIDNQLDPGATARFYISFDGSVQGIWSVSDCGRCGLQTVDIDIAFSPLFFAPQGIAFTLVNQPAGGGIAFRPDGVGHVSEFVPEPSSWALMIAGFGLAGAALRRTPSRAPVRTVRAKPSGHRG